jgi:hypothetical protein
LTASLHAKSTLTVDREKISRGLKKLVSSGTRAKPLHRPGGIFRRYLTRYIEGRHLDRLNGHPTACCGASHLKKKTLV